MRNSRQELEAALDFVRDLYDCRHVADVTDRTMAALRRIVAADRVVYGEYDVERQAARLSMQPAVVKDPDGGTGEALAALERGFGGHPLFRYFLQTGDGQAQRLSQVMTRARYRRYAQGDEFTGEMGARHQMGLFFPAGPERVTVVLLARSARDFQERERGLVNRLYPHLAQAMHTHESLSLYRHDVDELLEMLEGPTSSVIVLTGDGRVRRWSEQARTWIAQYCRTPFPAGGDRLPDCFADWYRRQLARVTHAPHATRAPTAREPLVVDRNTRQLTVQLVPDHLRDEHLLLLNEKERDLSWTAPGAHGLTPRESQVLAWVAKGKTNAEIGAILQLSGRTVQKHLEHVYQKLGVAGRTTATVCALRMLGTGGDLDAAA